MDLIEAQKSESRARYARGGKYASWAIPRRMWVSGVGGWATKDDEGWHCFWAPRLAFSRWSRAYLYRYHRHGRRFKLGLVSRSFDVEHLGVEIANFYWRTALRWLGRTFVNWKSRKLWFGIVSMVVGVLVARGVISDAQADTLTEMILTLLAVFIPFGVYTVGNVVEKFADAKRSMSEAAKIQASGNVLDDQDKKALATAFMAGQKALAEQAEKGKTNVDLAALTGANIAFQKLFRK